MITYFVHKQKTSNTLKVFKADTYTYEVRNSNKDVLAKAVIKDSSDTYELVDIWVVETMRNFGIGTTLISYVANDVDKLLKVTVDESDIAMNRIMHKLACF